MNKYLSALQVLSKIGRVLSEIVFIVCIVGAACCAAGIVFYAAVPEMVLKIGGVNIWGMIGAETILNESNTYVAMVMGLITCIGEIFLSKFANIYFKNEIKTGTPFTMEGAKEMLRLGILAICIPAGISVINGIISAITQTKASEIGAFSSIGLGIVFIIISVIIKCVVTMNDGPNMKDYVVEE